MKGRAYRITELHLHNFRSFRGKTCIEFHPSITCITGHCGTGKTSMLEAIRWVLGESSETSLRAGSMQDLIYMPMSGSLKNPFAEVIVVSGRGTVTRRIDNNGVTEWLTSASPGSKRGISGMLAGGEQGSLSFAYIASEMIGRMASGQDHHGPAAPGDDFEYSYTGKNECPFERLSIGERTVIYADFLLASCRRNRHPLLLFDGFDAPLDNEQCHILMKQLKSMAEYSQIIMISHHRPVINGADLVYEVNMDKNGVSTISER